MLIRFSNITVLKPDSPQDSSIAIFGAGAVGMAALFGATVAGIRTIIMIDLLEDRLTLARSLGATHTVNGKDPELVKKITDLSDGGVDYVVEATGAAPCIKAGYECMQNYGRYVQLGTPGPPHTNPVPIHDSVCASKSVIGCCEGQSNPPVYILELVKLYKEGRFPVDKISKRFSYKQFDDAVHAMHDGSVIKPVVVFDE